jgi:hypothetical protein
MLDTGASHTTFDINALLVAEYPIDNIVEKDIIETASGFKFEVSLTVKKGCSERYSLFGGSQKIFCFVGCFSKNVVKL